MGRGKEQVQRDLPPSQPRGSPAVQSVVTLADPAQSWDLGPARASTQVDKQVVLSYQQLQSAHHIPGGHTIIKEGTRFGARGVGGTLL